MGKNFGPGSYILIVVTYVFPFSVFEAGNKLSRVKAEPATRWLRDTLYYSSPFPNVMKTVHNQL